MIYKYNEQDRVVGLKADVKYTHYPSTKIDLDQERNRSQNEIRIDAVGLKKLGKHKVVLLNNISLSIPAGALVAVIGSSGAGKSTLLNALSGFQLPQKGKVLYDGRDYYRDLSIYRKELGYVPQDNIVHQNLTVERALYYAAKMRLPIDYTHRKRIKQRINEVLDAVDLTAQRRLRVNKLSGGQRKRVSIALELLDKPKVFFLDEPTSGLDAGLDYKIMHLLRLLADKQQTILVATHTTNNLGLCDYICFLAPGGRLAYFGPPDKALKFFGTDNFTQVYTMLEPSAKFPHAPEMAEAWFKASADYQTYIGSRLKEIDVAEVYWSKRHVPMSPKRCSAWKQFWLLSMRYLELLKNDPGSLLILLLQAPVIALMLVALMKYEIGTGMFSQTSIATCPTTASIFTSGGRPDISDVNKRLVSYSCNNIQKALVSDPKGKVYARELGGEMQALQNFIVMRSGGDAQKVLFIMSFTAILFGCVNAAREIVKEAPIYRCERAVSLGILPYIFSKFVVLGLLCLLQDAILVASVNAVAPFSQSIFLPAVFEIGITLWLTSLSGLALGLTISAIAPTTDRAMNFIPLILIPQVISAGTVFPFKTWPTQILAMLFTSRWSMGALGSTVGLHSDKLGGDKLLGQQDIYNGTLFSIYTHAEAVQHLLFMWKALGTMIILFICVVALILQLKENSRI